MNLIEQFKNEVLCRRESNQHKAKELFKQINKNKKYDWFYIEWEHYMIHHINRESFIEYIQELEKDFLK